MNTVLLAQIVAATVGGGFMFVTAEDAAPMLAASFIEQNPSMADASGSLATRATQAGIDFVNNQSQAAGQQTQAFQPAPAASIQTTTAPAATTQAGGMTATQASFARAAFKPPVKEKGSRVVAEKYPFGDLAAPAADGTCDAFFVAKTDKVPEPNKTLTSAASAANRRYATKVGTQMVAGKERARYDYSRKFEVFDGTADHTPNGAPGVWVARTK